MAFMICHSSVTTMLDAGVDLRDVQIAARHADPRTTERARQNLDHHPNYILGPSATSSASLQQAVRPRSARRTVTG
jgi:integrase/recombinase XerD